ncbi:MAG TPA: DNA-processing protein DprA [Candidatus Cybelea sp.]
MIEPPMWEPTYVPRDRIEAAREGRGFGASAAGLWVCGDLTGLALPCIAVVGTRAATPYGRRLAHRFALDLARSGCCIVSGLALGIDAAAHEGALDAGAPTIGVLGGGHRRFFPARNHRLAERMVAGGGAVLSPYPPEHAVFPPQFLQRNGIVAALADAVVVIEAPARSGALNTAGWAAGRVPVLAVPGDVDRKHVQGCLALIRDGATLARDAGDVLEAAAGSTSRLCLQLPRREQTPSRPRCSARSTRAHRSSTNSWHSAASDRRRLLRRFRCSSSMEWSKRKARRAMRGSPLHCAAKSCSDESTHRREAPARRRTAGICKRYRTCRRRSL